MQYMGKKGGEAKLKTREREKAQNGGEILKGRKDRNVT